MQQVRRPTEPPDAWVIFCERLLLWKSANTGLFTRRFASSKKYGRVLGCDYSESTLTEARRRIRSDSKLSPASLEPTRLDLVRLDVGQIPMQEGSVDCLHAGAAMHCWPDLDAAASEIYRVLKPGGGTLLRHSFSPTLECFQMLTVEHRNHQSRHFNISNLQIPSER